MLCPAWFCNSLRQSTLCFCYSCNFVSYNFKFSIFTKICWFCLRSDGLGEFCFILWRFSLLVQTKNLRVKIWLKKKNSKAAILFGKKKPNNFSKSELMYFFFFFCKGKGKALKLLWDEKSSSFTKKFRDTTSAVESMWLHSFSTSCLKTEDLKLEEDLELVRGNWWAQCPVVMCPGPLLHVEVSRGTSLSSAWDIRVLDSWHSYFFLLNDTSRHFQNSRHRQLSDSLLLISVALATLSAWAKATFGSWNPSF